MNGLQTIDRLTYKYEELFRGCMFGSDRCDESNFTSTFDIKYGKCFSFNFNDSTLISVSKTGSYQGLKLLLYSNLSDYFEITDTSGMRVVIHHQNTHPFASIRGHDAPIGMITTFSIKSSIASRISYGPHKCSTLNPSNFAYHGRYTPEACQRICFQRHYRLECGCIDARFPKMEDSDVFCSIDNIYQRACLNNVSVRITEIETGACDCPRACIEAIFASTISKAPLRDSFITFDPTNKSSHKDYVMLSVYYSSLSVDSLVEFPSYTFSNLISDLGGTVGFWLSMSLIGLYELVIFLSKLFTASLIYFRSFYVNRNISRVINLKSTYSTDEINNTERTINPTRRDWNYRLGRYRSEIEKGLVDKRQRHFIDLARILGINPSRVHQVHSNKLFQ
ncbi:hypothetical protein PRIPAC_76903 [Pristionchus pacificus]|uniref:Ion channel n=1 Tax=Pristionchus pacificus TaxID=54126 RepID=A0A2A6CAN6_PRIPA|nr:hypothetical protein PRIPAC_76903 [Pristionchus pacificus]|eukprot:PDM75244.1 ion channel [Pristionchus pacificus]